MVTEHLDELTGNLKDAFLALFESSGHTGGFLFVGAAFVNKARKQRHDLLGLEVAEEVVQDELGDHQLPPQVHFTRHPPFKHHVVVFVDKA